MSLTPNLPKAFGTGSLLKERGASNNSVNPCNLPTGRQVCLIGVIEIRVIRASKFVYQTISH